MYQPLELFNQLNIDEIPDTHKAKPYLLDMANGNEDLFQKICTDTSFGTAHYEGDYKDLSDYIHQNWINMYHWSTGYEPEKKVFNKANRQQVLDSLAGMVVISRWGRYKRAYRFDPELELALATVDEVRVPVKMLDLLPFKSFYVEFSPDGVFYPTFHGCFVELIRRDTGFIFRLMRLTPDLRMMSGTGTFSAENEEVVFKRADFDGKHDSDPNGLRVDWEEFCFFILNAMLYLCASNKEVRETTYTEKDRRYTKKHDGVDSNVIIGECGYVFGEKIRLQQKEAEKLENRIIRGTRARKSPRPHPVKASWQHYWKGTGENKQRILVFKAAYFMGGKTNYATISEVTE